jgi:hypothetical protein
MNVSASIQNAESCYLNRIAMAEVVKIMRIADKTNQQMSLAEEHPVNVFSYNPRPNQAS